MLLCILLCMLNVWAEAEESNDRKSHQKVIEQKMDDLIKMQHKEQAEISAVDALKKTERIDDAWSKLFKKINNEAEKGNDWCLFNEQTEETSFKEDAEEVEKKLKELGYRVQYRKAMDYNDYLFFKCYKETYHNVFLISWGHFDSNN